MSDLSQFGGGIEQSETGTEEGDSSDSRYKYKAGRCRGITNDGDRCRASASEGDLCYNHDLDDHCVTIDSDAITLIEWTSRTKFENLEDLDVDEDLIREAVHNVVGLRGRPLPVYEEGIWLPQRFCEADQLIVRTPAKTTDSRRTGDEPQRRISSLATADDWDPDYLVGEGRTAEIRNEECLPGEDGVPKIGLKIAGEEQRWFPVEIEGGELP
ncbi:hypothetical protein [Natrinema salsiterrestre]|uniref:Uncharacterized protein n=1 Tax=Natrinema salsiterrestre TaxID=2950540 RepID=A0A9Q4L7L2_9EURY|nr:hypothetical protein [Natrinema salsiterrestre]MDF9748393.1 hypothetical protein [Natrinema salsiterrestre]